MNHKYIEYLVICWCASVVNYSKYVFLLQVLFKHDLRLIVFIVLVDIVSTDGDGIIRFYCQHGMMVQNEEINRDVEKQQHVCCATMVSWCCSGNFFLVLIRISDSN